MKSIQQYERTRLIPQYAKVEATRSQISEAPVLSQDSCEINAFTGLSPSRDSRHDTNRQASDVVTHMASHASLDSMAPKAGYKPATGDVHEAFADALVARLGSGEPKEFSGIQTDANHLFAKEGSNPVTLAILS
jgi:hypothetical protein